MKNFSKWCKYLLVSDIMNKNKIANFAGRDNENEEARMNPDDYMQFLKEANPSRNGLVGLFGMTGITYVSCKVFMLQIL